MSENSKDIENEQEKIRNKIRIIKESGVFNKVKGVLKGIRQNFRNFGIRNVRLEGRIKKEDSASDKIARQGVSADEIYDLIAFMLVVDLPEEYESAKEMMKDIMPKDSYVHDFDGKLPENNGYSSFHMGINVGQFLSENGMESPENLYNLYSEVQLKTYGMYTAQEATHESIYKNKNLNEEQKNEMQSVMFPLIERITDIEKYEERLEISSDENERNAIQSKISQLKQEVLQQKIIHKEYIESNIDGVEDVLKQYVVVKYIEKLRQNPLLGLSREKIVEITEQCNNAIKYLSKDFEQERMSNTEPTGFRNTDDLLQQTQDKTIEQIQELSTKSQEKQVPTLLDSAIQTSETNITSRDIKTMTGTIAERGKTQEQQLHTSDKKQEDDGR